MSINIHYSITKLKAQPHAYNTLHICVCEIRTTPQRSVTVLCLPHSSRGIKQGFVTSGTGYLTDLVINGHTDQLNKPDVSRTAGQNSVTLFYS